MNFKRLLSIGLTGVLLTGAITSCSSSTSEPSEPTETGDESASTDSGETYELVIAHITDENNTWHKASLYFEDYVEEHSDGRISVEIYPNNTLGSEVEVIQSILTNGGADITFTGESMQTYKEELGIIGMPYAVTSDEHMDAVLNGEVGEELAGYMLDTGMRVIGHFTRGPRNITSNIPINTPEDLQGFIIRTPQSPMTVAAFEAMGAKPTPMAFSEVFTSLQQSVIDGQENPLAMIKSGGFSEVQKYVNETEHLRSWVYMAIGEEKFQSLPEDLQQVVIDAGELTQEYEHELFLEEEQNLRAELESEGMEFIEVDQTKFAEVAVPGVEAVLTDAQAKIYEKIKAANPNQ